MSPLRSGEGWAGTAELFGRLGPWQRYKHAVRACMAEAGLDGPYWEWCDRSDCGCDGGWWVLLYPDDEFNAWCEQLEVAVTLCAPLRPMKGEW